MTLSCARSHHFAAGTALLVLGLLWAGPAAAQQAPDSGETPANAEQADRDAGESAQNAEGTAKTDRAPGRGAETNGEATFTVPVNVEHGETGEPLADQGVILRASRPRGPMERREPKPRYEFVGQTNEEGTALFTDVPVSLTTSGLELYAVTSYGNVTFKSQRVSPSMATHLTLEVYEKALSLDSFHIDRLRTMVQVWEKNVWITQHWYLSVDGPRPIDVSLLDGAKYEDGIPLELPLNAKNISVNGPGESKVINSTVNWTGTLKPGEPKVLRMRFRMTADTPEFVYRQQVDYPVEEVDATTFIELGGGKRAPKIKRLDTLEMAAPKFEKVEYTANPPQLPPNEALYARGLSLKPGESFAFKLYGLPFDRPVAPWIFLGLGILGIGFVMLVGLRRSDLLASDEGRRRAIATLQSEREELLDELAAVQDAFEEGRIDEVDYEAESLQLRERIALVVRKIDELSEDD